MQNNQALSKEVDFYGRDHRAEQRSAFASRESPSFSQKAPRNQADELNLRAQHHSQSMLYEEETGGDKKLEIDQDGFKNANRKSRSRQDSQGFRGGSQVNPQLANAVNQSHAIHTHHASLGSGPGSVLGSQDQTLNRGSLPFAQAANSSQPIQNRTINSSLGQALPGAGPDSAQQVTYHQQQQPSLFQPGGVQGPLAP